MRGTCQANQGGKVEKSVVIKSRLALVETHCCGVADLLAPPCLTIESQAKDASDYPDNVRVDDRCRLVI
jgi:hypothetical protein